MPAMHRLVLMILVAPFVCCGQSSTQFGARAGVNMARMADKAYDSDYLYGFHAGIYFRGSTPFTVQVEMQYSGQGGTFRNLTTGETDERRLHYLNPSLMARYSPNDSYAFVGGLQMGVLIVARSGSLNISDNYDPMDLGFQVGIEYKFNNRWSGTTRFLQSLRNIGNQVLQLSICFAIQDRI